MADRDTHQPEDIPVGIGEAAKVLGVSVDTVRTWANGGRLPCIRTLGGQRRFYPSDLAAVLAGREPNSRAS